MRAGSSENSLPRWETGSPYPGLDSPEFNRDKDILRRLIGRVRRTIGLFASGRERDPGKFLLSYIRAFNEAADLHENLFSYAYMMYTVETGNAAASRELGALETIGIPLRRAEVEFRNLLAGIPAAEVPRREKALRPYGNFIREQLFLQKRQMPPDMEELAADLSRSGADAWERLQQAVSAGVTMEWKKGQRKTLVELRSLASHPDRRIREKAYRLELEGWERAAVPVAFALNGVKGFSISLNGRRGWRSTLEKSVRQARMSPAAFEALIDVMTESLPVFRRYYRAKARLLGLPKLAFFDLFAPAGKASRRWTYPGAADFIAEKFYRFSPELGDFALRALRGGWIDAEPRKGKIGGAYCISLPLARESRIFCNFDGSFSSVTTLAHELGHAYHHEVLKDAGAIHRSYPMTLAETASIFSETIVMEEALGSASPEERLFLVENFLQDSGQVVVDILSRYLFEKEIFSRRERGDVSPEELGAAMLDAQEKTYGPILDEKFRHPYMWAVMGHYYRNDLAFYNFPYAFGLLFALGLASRCEKEGPAFAAAYRRILASAGSLSADDTARLAGFDIGKREFWRMGIDRIARKVEIFEGLVNA